MYTPLLNRSLLIMVLVCVSVLGTARDARADDLADGCARTGAALAAAVSIANDGAYRSTARLHYRVCRAVGSVRELSARVVMASGDGEGLVSGSVGMGLSACADGCDAQALVHTPDGDGYGRYEVRAQAPFRAVGEVLVTWEQPGLGGRQLRLPLVMGSARAAVAVKVRTVVHRRGQLTARLTLTTPPHVAVGPLRVCVLGAPNRVSLVHRDLRPTVPPGCWQFAAPTLGTHTVLVRARVSARARTLPVIVTGSGWRGERVLVRVPR